MIIPRSVSNTVFKKKIQKSAPKQVSNPVRQIIDIEGNEKIKFSPSYEHWARIHNLKINSQTLIYLKEHGINDIDEFNKRYQSAMGNFLSTNKALSATDNRIKVLEELQKQLRQYSRTRDNYKLYKAQKNPEKFLRENYGIEGDVMIHEMAKKHFDRYIAQYGKPLPKMSAVIEELTSLKSVEKTAI